MIEKPLFIPLCTQWFREFEAGTKDTEYRAYGPRWNERTCRVGRRATISHGYNSAQPCSPSDLVRDLTAMRDKHGSQTLIGWRCSNIIEQIACLLDGSGNPERLPGKITAQIEMLRRLQ